MTTVFVCPCSSPPAQQRKKLWRHARTLSPLAAQRHVPTTHTHPVQNTVHTYVPRPRRGGRPWCTATAQQQYTQAYRYRYDVRERPCTLQIRTHRHEPSQKHKMRGSSRVSRGCLVSRVVVDLFIHININTLTTLTLTYIY